MKELITVGQIIDRAWDHYRKHFVELISVSAWLLILAILYIISFAFYPSSIDVYYGTAFSVTENLAIYLAMLSSFFIGPIIGLWIFIALIRLINQEAMGKRTNLKNLLKTSWKYFLPLVFVNFLFTILIISPALLIIPGIILSFIGSTTSAGILGTIGAALLLIGIFAGTIAVIWWSVRYFFIGYAVILDNKRGKAAFTQSRQLVQGRFWPILWRLVVPKIVFLLAFALIQFIILLVLTMSVKLVAGLNLELADRLLSIVNSVTFIVVTVIINPIILIADYLIYENAKSGKGKRS